MKNYWLDQANLCVKESCFELSERYGMMVKTELSNGHKLESWVDKDGMLNTCRADEDADPNVMLYHELEFEMHERVAEEEFGTMVSQNWTDTAKPLIGAFSFFPSSTEVWGSPKVEIVCMGDCIAIKFLSRLNHTDYPCYLEADINELADITGTMYITCPLGQLVFEKAKMWSTHTINGYYLFTPVVQKQAAIDVLINWDFQRLC